MIKVLITKKHGQIIKVQAKGHSGYGPAGKDIICAGVSALLQALKIGLEDLAGHQLGSIEEGFLACPVGPEPTAQFLARVIELSLIEMAMEYPKYLQVERGEGDV